MLLFFFTKFTQSIPQYKILLSQR
ncbi:hypothetical protein HAINFHK1212_1806, partial [Haemophilus influenzae HK1212]